MTEDIKQMVDSALGQVTTTPKTWETPEQYKAETNKRFRLRKDEIAKFGSDEAGRLAAFKARLAAGQLE